MVNMAARRAATVAALLVVVVVAGCVGGVAASTEQSLTLLLDAGENQCIYEDVAEHMNIRMEFQVIAGANLDVDYTVVSPSGHVRDQGKRLTHSMFKGPNAEPGTWKFCFSNRFSVLHEKAVHFSLILDDGDPVESWESQLPVSPAGETVESITKYAMRLRVHFKQIIRDQTHLWAREARHRQTAQFNNERIGVVSAVEIAIIISIGLIQVYVVRSFFKTPSTKAAAKS
ncbi:hypothetical protein PTSG_03959 [Salpingoeca rosetta]|uniref:GOLD domain-containing protein n=1 Tax=Salpingoeca rosetta (strain ATCC 50818 / BSB-021) TaxID=946362 RepID=F2U7D4_SALR5|nr:uncharacterized protein PTSG_03959 [Salpingoeca rosetta]EGD83351.1 hypothetical protein PTSG_03959 [Salpingoeca rosetta]|eukprot:XP_004994855.1 hypothetical protein PTSG_03959 [Salpingoeca rosetta]